jgi:hypothetical protein
MNVQRNIDACSCKHCGSGEAMSIKYYECMFLRLISSMQCACAILYRYLWRFRVCYIFTECLMNNTFFEKSF